MYRSTINKSTIFWMPQFFRRSVLALAGVMLFLLSHSVNAQEDDLGTEVVNIVKPYTPTISDAFKVKETPVLNDSVSTTKKEVSYSIFSVPVASTFTPAKGKATNVEKAKPIKLYDNYATLGFGNYTSILGEFYSNFQISRTDNAGVFFRHNSSQGGIKDVLLDDQFYDTSLDANYTSRQRDASYGLNVGLEHQHFNWYGLRDEVLNAPQEILFNINPNHSYLSGYLGGQVAIEDSYFQQAAINVRYLSDSFSSSEIRATLKPEFSFPVSNFDLKVDLDIDYLSGSFERGYFNLGAVNYGYLNAGVLPSLVHVNKDLTLSIGAGIFVGLDTENSLSNFYIFPKINASYRLVDELLIAYGGADGGLQQNTYYGFKEENPFVSPTLGIMPTNKIFEGFAGLKGKLSNSIGYNIRASYSKDEDRALFQANPYKGISSSFEGYEHGNSFSVLYDDINTFEFFGELKVEVANSFTLGVNGNFYSYDTTNQLEAWNLPTLEASLFSNFNITEQLYGGVSLFYVGERKDIQATVGPVIDLATIVTLDGFADANIHLGYRVSDRLSIFAKGSNLFSNNYQKWLNFPVQGIQGLLGATYKFDW